MQGHVQAYDLVQWPNQAPRTRSSCGSGAAAHECMHKNTAQLQLKSTAVVVCVVGGHSGVNPQAWANSKFPRALTESRPKTLCKNAIGVASWLSTAARHGITVSIVTEAVPAVPAFHMDIPNHWMARKHI